MLQTKMCECYLVWNLPFPSSNQQHRIQQRIESESHSVNLFVIGVSGTPVT
jgi:hypothetical protein